MVHVFVNESVLVLYCIIQHNFVKHSENIMKNNKGKNHLS